MGNGGHVLDEGDFQAHGLQGADGGLTTGAGALDVHLHGLQPVLHGGLCSRLGGGLSGEGSGFTGTTEAQAARGGPAQGVAAHIGHSDHGVVEGGADMNNGYCC